MSDNKITFEARVRSLSELPVDTIQKIRDVEIARAEYQLRKMKLAFGDHNDIDFALEADGVTFAQNNKGWEP